MTHHFDADKYVGEHLGVKYELLLDGDPQNPRKDCDWLGTMACKHGRYDLGDEDGQTALIEAIRNSSFYRDVWENGEDGQYRRFYIGDASEPNDQFKFLDRCKDIIALPMYLYDHSGITMSTGQFSCSFDSGQVGYIFVTLKTLWHVYGNPKHKAMRITAEIRQKAIDCLKAEVDVYDHYLTGEVYGYNVPGDDGMGSSCYGFYSDEEAAASAEEYIGNLSDDDRATIISAQAASAGDEED